MFVGFWIPAPSTGPSGAETTVKGLLFFFFFLANEYEEISRRMDQSATSEERLNRDKTKRREHLKKKEKKERHHLFAPSEVCPSPLSTPQFHPKTEVRTVFNIVLGKKIPGVPVEKGSEGWMSGRTDGWVGVTVSPNEPMEGDSCVRGALLLFLPSLIRTGTTFCLCTSASSETEGMLQ